MYNGYVSARKKKSTVTFTPGFIPYQCTNAAFVKWEERLVPLCGVSATEPQGTSYYWAQDLDGEPDTLWGLEGYTHAVGFFLGHPSSDIFKREMALVDKDKLLKTQQGLGSPDYDLHYYDFESGYLTLQEDKDKDSTTGHVAVEHFWVKEGKRSELLKSLGTLAEAVQKQQAGGDVKVQSCAVLKECVFSSGNMATLWTR